MIKAVIFDLDNTLTDFMRMKENAVDAAVDAMVDAGVKPWDIGPAAVLVEAAGGKLTDLHGNPSIHRGSALATNGHLHDAMLAVCAGSTKRITQPV